MSSTQLNEQNREPHYQKVMYVDIYETDMGENGIWISETKAGYTWEGHGGGIRILFDREQTTGEQARKLLLAFVKHYRTHGAEGTFDVRIKKEHKKNKKALLEAIENGTKDQAAMAFDELRHSPF